MENRTLSKTIFLLSSSLIVASSSITMFFCICKIWDNLVKKIPHPFLLSDQWLITCAVSSLFLAIALIIKLIGNVKTHLNILRTGRAIGLFLVLSDFVFVLPLISIYLISVTIITLYLLKIIKPEILEKTIKILTIVYTIAWPPVVFFAACLLTLLIVLCAVLCGYLFPNAAQRIRTQLCLLVETIFNDVRVGGVDIGNTGVMRNSINALRRFIESDSFLLESALKNSGDFDYETGEGNNKITSLTVEKLKSLFDNLGSNSSINDFGETSAYFRNLNNLGTRFVNNRGNVTDEEVRGVLIDCIFKILESDERTKKVLEDTLSLYKNSSENKSNQELKEEVKTRILGRARNNFMQEGPNANMNGFQMPQQIIHPHLF